MGEREGGDLGQICIIHKRKKYFAIHISKICDSVSGAGFLRLVNCETNVKTSLYSRTWTKKQLQSLIFVQGRVHSSTRVYWQFLTESMHVSIPKQCLLPYVQNVFRTGMLLVFWTCSTLTTLRQDFCSQIWIPLEISHQGNIYQLTSGLFN